MPGILPMKVIKVGTSAQTRIAQACDRCRSKKIRCDGFRPTCTQCANVGFECKTSDKLSRRAFPRGYTESLEERVRALETEVRELKDLLDEKDEKIEMLSKMHSYSPHSISSRRPSSIHSNQEKTQIQASVDLEKDIRFKLQQSPYLIHGDNTDLYFVGNSSSRAFIIAFRRKLQECGKGNCDLNIDALFTPSPKPSLPTLMPANESAFWSPPSRMHSDQMVNIFFQEWAPLFPVLHRLNFLTLYEQYVANASNVQDKKSLAQLNLVFGIASLSSESRVIHSADLCERQWTTALDSFIKETSLVTLQCLILAQIYYIQKGEPEKVLQYKGFAIAISQRLGLHLSQKRFALGVLTVETRKKVFWSLYAVDCFSAAMLGLPKMLREEDIFCEYPQDADDEYVTETGFQPSLPGEATKLSSALALFRGCRILGKVLNQNYPAASSHELSLNAIAALNDELEEWSSGLPSHLKLTFVQDKPSTNTISSRSPLLSLTYNFIRTLIHRPVVSANLGDRASSSVVALAGAHKQIVQIIQLLEERNLCFSHCLNKNEILLTSGIGLLFQSLELERAGKMMKNSQRLICQVINLLDSRNAQGSAEFKQLGCSMLALPMMSPSPTNGPMASASKRSKGTVTPASPERRESHQHIAHLATSYTQYTASQQRPKEKISKDQRRVASSLTDSLAQQTIRRSSDKSLRPLAPSLPSHTPSRTSLSTPAMGVTSATTFAPKHSQSPAINVARTNLDYFSFSDAPDTSNNPPRKPAVDDSQWQSMLNTLESDTIDKSSSNSVYGWPPMETLLSPTTVEDSSGVVQSASPKPDEWAPELWFNDETAHIPQSVLSLSDESLTSGEEFSSVEYGSTRSDSGFRTISIPQLPGAYTPEEFGDVDTFHQDIGV